MDLHAVTHGVDGFGSNVELAYAIAWHMKHYGNLVAKLRDTAEGPGTLLDRTVVIFLPEGGCGEQESEGTPYERMHSRP